MIRYDVGEDIELIRDLLGLSTATLASEVGISRMTLSRWAKSSTDASPDNLEKLYGFAFSQGIHLNEMHAQLFVEESASRGLVPLFHGSKSGIEGALSLGASRPGNDFGPGLYCGESFAQSTMFVARYPRSVCYFAACDARALNVTEFHVDGYWMLAVALFRGKLDGFAANARIEQIRERVSLADCVKAPIADNRMFELIDSFLDGEITDVQCEHCLSATNLGRQYVLRSSNALAAVVTCRPRYLCKAEKEYYLARQQVEAKVGIDKTKMARRAYRGQGRYIEELLS